MLTKEKAVATKPLWEKQVKNKTVGYVSEKKHNTEKCKHPQCYVSQKGRIAGAGKFSHVTFSGKKLDQPETSKAAEKRSQIASSARNGIGYKGIGKQLAHEYKQEQERWLKARIAQSNYQKWKLNQATENLNARARRNLARKAKFAEKQTQKPDRYLKASYGAPRDTPREKIILTNDNLHSKRIPPYVPVRQKHVSKKFIQKWIPTGRTFDSDGSIKDMRT